MNRFPRVSPSYGKPRYRLTGPVLPADTGTDYTGPRPWTPDEQRTREARRERRLLDAWAHTHNPQFFGLTSDLTPRLVRRIDR
jgi:hypothetical protein